MAKKAKKVTYSGLQNLIVQSLLIVFSVLLALFLYEIREQQKVVAELKTAYRNIHEEVESNRAAIAEIVRYHQQGTATIDSLLERQNPNVDMEFVELILRVFPKGLNSPNLQSAAWSTFNSVGLSKHQNIQEIYPLTKLYELQQKGVENTRQEIMRFVAQPEHFEKQRNMAHLKALKFLLDELCQQEKHLLAETDKVLNNVNNWRYFEE